jgi:uncharacterized protein YcbX
MTSLGRVAALWRYPVKSMAGESLASVDVGWHGLAGDRRWAFVRGDVPRSGFPWHTIRQRAEMAHYRPSFAEPSRPDSSRVLVGTPDGRVVDVLDPALAAELGEGVRLIKQDRGVFDAMPLSLITTQTVAGLGALVGRPLDFRRFRPNLLVAADEDAAAFPEEGWVGAELRIGGLRMRVDQSDERCAVINVDPETLEHDPSVLKTVGRERDAKLGAYGSVVEPGRVAVGDRVELA